MKVPYKTQQSLNEQPQNEMVHDPYVIKTFLNHKHKKYCQSLNRQNGQMHIILKLDSTKIIKTFKPHQIPISITIN